MAYRRGRYTYRSRREGGHVKTQYLGTGVLARVARMRDACRKGRRAQLRAEWQAQLEHERELDAQLDAVGAQVKLLTEAFLLASGYHTHKQEWRRQR